MIKDRTGEQKGKVLIIDDSPANLHLLMKILTAQGYDVYPAAEGELALKFVESILPDLILLDIMMPEMDGYEVCERLKVSGRTRDIPIIFISAADQLLDKVKAFAMGGVDYIVKPFQTEEVQARVKTHLALRLMQKQLEAQNAQLQQEIIERQKVEEELWKYKERLEEQVAERTAELSHANAQLQREITERKQAEEAHRESEERFRMLAHISPVGIFRGNAEGQCVYVNERWCEIAGLTSEEAQGEGWAQNLHPNDREYIFTEWSQIIKDNLPFKSEYRFQRPDGVITWVLGQAVAETGPTGEMIGYAGTITDITEHKRAEEALRQEEERFRYVALATRDAIYDWDLRTNMVWRNEAYQTLYSANKPVEIEETWWQQHLHPDDRQRVVESISQAFRDGNRFWSGQYRFLRFDGSYATVIDRGYILYDQVGQSVRMIGAITDITERQQATAEREALIAELEAKNAELERFTYTVSHDLKSPLITIRGFLSFVERAALAGNIQQVQTDLTRIANATDRMYQLLNELLELSRIGRVINPPEVVSMDDLVQEAVDMVAGRLAERSVQVMIGPNLPLVYGDRPRLREVLENLVDNAVKYMGHQPHPRVEIGARYDSEESIFYVRDNGMGIDLRYQHKVFGLFDKLDPNTEGVGVGLTIAKRIVEVHRGRIWVESDGLERGSTFYFTLPLARQ